MFEYIVATLVALYTLWYFWRAFEAVWADNISLALYNVFGGIVFAILTAINIRFLP